MNTGKILLVEDNDDDVILMQRAFKKNRMTNAIVRARNGVEALDLLHNQNIIPSLVILDLKLPKVDGLEVLKSIRANEFTRGLPVVILTTSAEQQDVVQGYQLGTNSYIRKPVEFEKFLEAVGQVGLYWMVINEPNPQYNG